MSSSTVNPSTNQSDLKIRVNASQIQTIEPSSIHQSNNQPVHPASLDHDDNSKTRRQTGLTLFGLQWMLGAEDMLVPAACSLLSDWCGLIAAIVAAALLPMHYTTDESNNQPNNRWPASCSEDQFTSLKGAVIGHVVLFGLLTLIDCLIIYSAWYANQFDRHRSSIDRSLAARLFIAFCITGLSLYSAIMYFGSVRADCAVDESMNRSIDQSCMALFVISLIECSFIACFFGCSYGLGRLCRPRSHESWRSSLIRLFTGSDNQSNNQSGDEDERDVFSSVATIFSEFFSASIQSHNQSNDQSNTQTNNQELNIVPSDVAVALCLVAADQEKRKRDGERFYSSAGSRRWDLDYINQWYNQSLNQLEERELRNKLELNTGEKQSIEQTIKRSIDRQSHDPEHDPEIQPVSPPLITDDDEVVEIGKQPDNQSINQTNNSRDRVQTGRNNEITPLIRQSNKQLINQTNNHGIGSVDVDVALTPADVEARQSNLQSGPSFIDREASQRRNSRRHSINQSPFHSPNQTPRNRSNNQSPHQTPNQTPNRSNHASLNQSPLTLSPEPSRLPNDQVAIDIDGRLGVNEKKQSRNSYPDQTNDQSNDQSVDQDDEEDLAEVAFNGKQPELQPNDWHLIADGQHFYEYACGSYGHLLYTFNHPVKSVCCMRLCCHCQPPFPYPGELEGTGCSPCPKFCKPSIRDSFKCCMLSARAFTMETGINPAAVLYCHLSSAPVYYLAVDQSTKSLIVAVRGTLSLADCLIDLDAQLSSLAPFGFPHGYTHTGILRNALRLRDHLDKKGVMDQFLRLNPDYSLVVVGHSLGAGTAGLLTLILRARFARSKGDLPNASDLGGQPGTKPVTTPSSYVDPAGHEQLPEANHMSEFAWPRSLRCFIYGPPLLVDALTAQSPFAMSSITTFIVRDDVVSRLSLASMFELKQAMMSAYERSMARKWRIMELSLTGRWEQMDKFNDPNYRPGPAPLDRIISNISSKKRQPSSIALTGHAELTSIIIDHQVEQPLPKKSVKQHHNNEFAPPPSPPRQPATSFSFHLRRLHLPGRIYLLVPRNDIPRTLRRSVKNMLVRHDEEWFVFPAAHESFGEIIVSSNMFADHVPRADAFSRVQVPEQFRTNQMF